MKPQPDAQYSESPSPETSQALSALIMGFRLTQMIYVAAKLGIADLLKDGPKGSETLAQATGTHAPSLYRLLRALASYGLFTEDEEGRFTLTPMAKLLQSDVPGSLRSNALYVGDGTTWRTWGDLMYSVTTGEPAFPKLFGMDAWEYRAKNPELNANFDRYMTAQTLLQTAGIVAAYDFSGIGTLVDVGGGHGSLMAAILKANPSVKGILCDAPHVVAGAGQLLEEAGVRDRCEIVPCDFFSSVPGGGDAYVLKSIIHDWDDEQAIAILKTCRRAVPTYGRLLLIESVISPGNSPDPAKLTDMQMMVALGGRERTEAEYGALMSEAGFRLTQVVPAQGGKFIIEGVPTA